MKFVAIFLLAFVSIHALPDGAPTRACRNLLPFHGAQQGVAIGRQNTPSPYKVNLNFNQGRVLVSVTSSLGSPFEGFMIQARNQNQEVIGRFEPTSKDAKVIDCDDSGDTATHSSTNQKSTVNLQWDPLGYEGPIVFNATVAQDYATYWTSVATTVDVNKRALSQEGNFPKQGGISTTTPPYFTPTEGAKEASTEFDPFYKGCDVDKSCFGAPDGCVATKNCKAVVAVNVFGDKYEFEMKAINNPAWVGFGLSDDTFMGDDSVVECVQEGGNVKAFMSYTNPRPNLDVKRLPKSQEGIELLSGSYADGTLTCRVRRDVVTNVNNKEFNLEKNQYYLLIGAGSKIHANKVSFHDLAYLASGEKRALSDVSALKGASKLLLRIHGAFMIAAWIGTASVGILLARYYRQTWVGSQLCGKDQWFAWHRLFMVLTWTLTTAGFILIFVELKAWSSENNPHAILGLITTILCFIQPIGAYFRPHPGTSKRPIFNWAHWFLGNAAHIIGIVTIFFAIKLNKAELPDWFYWIMTAYVAFHVVMHLLLSIMGCQSDRSMDKRVSSFPMKDLGTGRMSAYSDRNSDAPYSALRKFLLAIYIVVVLLLVVCLIFVTVVAPVDEFWDKMVASTKSK